jgi:hypothetical protein
MVVRHGLGGKWWYRDTHGVIFGVVYEVNGTALNNVPFILALNKAPFEIKKTR